MTYLSCKRLRPFLFTYITLPILVFIAGFLRWYWAIPMSALLVYVFSCAVNGQNRFEKTIPVSRRELGFWFLFVLLFTHLCGLSGFWYQTTDWNARNPIFKDIITKSWPVYYEGRDTALAYYIGFWLVPALPAKLVNFLFGVDAGWLVGHFSLWLWASVGVYLLLLGTFVMTGGISQRARVAVAAVLLGFSGLDVIGMLLTKQTWVINRFTLHLEWWYLTYEFSSITTCLCWVFNQTIIPWVCILCFLMEKDCRNYALIGISCLLCGPLPLVGMAVLMLTRTISDGISSKKWKITIRNAFSVQNIAAFLCIFPPIAMYILSNNAAAAGIKTDAVEKPTFWGMLLFLFLEAGIYLILLFRNRRRDPLFYAVAVTLMACPFVRIGARDDFCMRVSVPGILLIAFWSADTVAGIAKDGLPKKKKARCMAIALLITLTIGAVTPGVELYRGIYQVVKQKTIFLENREYDSLEEYADITINFEASDPKERVFYRWFGKKLVGGRENTVEQ